VKEVRPSGNPVWNPDDPITAVRLNNIENALKEVETVNLLPSAGDAGRIVRLSANQKFYLDNGSNWQEIIDSETASRLVINGGAF
jgi:hypothetical protein